MEAKCAAIWSSMDAKSEESEMIAHLQSMFWSNSDVAANFCSPNTSASSCVTASTAPTSLFLPLDNEGYYSAPMVNTGMDLCTDHRHQTVIGHKRVSCMDEQVKKTSKKSRTVPSKRRERINEKLRVLQQLIPNGTKVDISTMLEDAVQYVKFLQLQIKVLSSDETWMYAPLAYNGMDISLSLRTGADQE
ncbi:hypothetical protein ACQ4PT_003986 [Festuca glaucescens]